MANGTMQNFENIYSEAQKSESKASQKEQIELQEKRFLSIQYRDCLLKKNVCAGIAGAAVIGGLAYILGIGKHVKTAAAITAVGWTGMYLGYALYRDKAEEIAKKMGKGLNKLEIKVKVSPPSFN